MQTWTGIVPTPDAAPEAVVRFSHHGVEGWLVVDTLRDGLAFGGFRFSPSVTEAEVGSLARAMTWKLAGHGMPTGGAKGGLRCDPKDPRIVDWIAAFAAHCDGPLKTVAILGKDMGATDAAIDQLYASLGIAQLELIRSRTTSRDCPKRIRDLAGYVPNMTGRGVAWATKAAVGNELAGRRVAIQGAGAVGIGSAVRLGELGANVVAISDASGTIAARHGSALPIEDLVRVARAGILDRAACRFLHDCSSRDVLLEADVDVLVLAASSHSVDDTLAARIRAPIVTEGANFALTEPARRVLAARNILVIPDVIASSSSAAMVTHQLASGNAVPPDELWTNIERAIARSVELGIADARRLGITVRQAYLQRFGEESHA
jgi:glutamate dehydrogenase (NAD(P)+)